MRTRTLKEKGNWENVCHKFHEMTMAGCCNRSQNVVCCVNSFEDNNVDNIKIFFFSKHIINLIRNFFPQIKKIIDEISELKSESTNMFK